MSPPMHIAAAQLLRLIGLSDCPAILDVRTDEDFAADPRSIPGSERRDWRAVQAWANGYQGQKVIVICQRGAKLSQGVAAHLRVAGVDAESLECGFEAWRAAGGPLVASTKLPKPDAQGRTVWVTRARPKIDRIACPWLIRRFIDRHAVLLFVAPADVLQVAERFEATPFDVEGVLWSHRNDRCTFDTMLDEFGLDTPALRQLATIVRGADTNRNELAPQAAGLLAVSLGLSRMYKSDLAQLDAAMTVYDALYRWCRDATAETHDWTPSTSIQKGI